MKIIKTYVLEKPLDKDVAGFIRDAKAGCYHWDQKYGGEGLKMIRHYFKFIQKEFDQENYALARTVYKKLIFMLCDTSKFDYFNYTDIIDIGRLNFEKITGNYFTCLVKLCTVKELFEEYCEYVKAKEEYYFEAADKTIVDQLDKKSFRTFERMVYKKAKTLTKKDYGYWKAVSAEDLPAIFPEDCRLPIEDFKNSKKPFDLQKVFNAEQLALEAHNIRSVIKEESDKALTYVKKNVEGSDIRLLETAQKKIK